LPRSSSPDRRVSFSARVLVPSMMNSVMVPLASHTLRSTKKASRLASEAAAKVSCARRTRRRVRVICHDHTHTRATMITSSALPLPATHK
jgi:hypothetical protein